MSEPLNLPATTRRKPVRGHRQGGRTNPMMAVTFTPEMFETIVKLAEQNNTSFSNQVRALLAKALQ